MRVLPNCPCLIICKNFVYTLSMSVKDSYASSLDRRRQVQLDTRQVRNVIRVGVVNGTSIFSCGALRKSGSVLYLHTVYNADFPSIGLLNYPLKNCEIFKHFSLPSIPKNVTIDWHGSASKIRFFVLSEILQFYI
jgi:hypothetical protein